MRPTSFALPALAILALACSTTPRSAERAPSDSVTTALPAPGPPPESPAAIRENLSMIGAVIRSIEVLEGDDYRVTLEIRTALPAGTAENLVEPGQTLVVRPAYVLDGDGVPVPGNARNTRLQGVAFRSPGEALLGKVSLGPDGTWLLIDTEF